MIAEVAFSVLDLPVRLAKVPPWVMRVAAWTYGLFNRRMGEFLQFVQLAAMHSCVAPIPGTRLLREHFAERAQALRKPPR